MAPEPAKNTNNNMTLITMVNYGSEIEMLIDAGHAHQARIPSNA